ncbi:MAG TPA: serine/threonine-protein kinase [Polyangiaceae bacterium]|jgi:serine/threonine-protein kinase|nr:serine/threonine-protein kinase [Polyangiaceae bacterium]
MQPPQLRPGVKVGRYELVRALGGGAGGSVYEANDGVLFRRVAVKVLNVPLAGGVAAEQAEARFVREGRIASRIRHPNVIDVFDFGVHDGVPFLVMEFVDGESLAQVLLREVSLTLPRALDVLLPVLSAVAALHAKGVVHRDIKPANVLLPWGNWTRPKLADFGVSRYTNDPQTSPKCGAIVGTLEYMAPELTGESRPDEELADQYALGVLLYECTAGRRPFVGATDYELMHAVASAELTPPSRLTPALPGAFDAVVRRAMDRDPQRRYGAVEQLAEALLAFASEAAQVRWKSDRLASAPETPHEGDDAPASGQTPVSWPSSAPLPASSSAPSHALSRPARSSSPPPPRSSRYPASPDAVGGARPSVLVVDDDDLNLRTFKRAFRGDFEITCADSGAQALELLARVSPFAAFDVALVDYAMPGMNGVEFLRAARIARPDLAAVMVTAHGDLPEVRAALAGGSVHAVIMKPFHREAIVRWVRHCHRLATMRKTVGVMMSQVK